MAFCADPLERHEEGLAVVLKYADSKCAVLGDESDRDLPTVIPLDFLEKGSVAERSSEIVRKVSVLRLTTVNAACAGLMTTSWRKRQGDVGDAHVRWKRFIPEIRSDDLPALPDNWFWTKLANVCERVSVGHVGPSKAHYSDGEDAVPYIRSQNVRPGQLDLSEVIRITPAFHKQLKKSKLVPGDLAVSRRWGPQKR